MFSRITAPSVAVQSTSNTGSQATERPLHHPKQEKKNQRRSGKSATPSRPEELEHSQDEAVILPFPEARQASPDLASLDGPGGTHSFLALIHALKALKQIAGTMRGSGRKAYSTVKKEQRSKIRKGAILDHQAK